MFIHYMCNKLYEHMLGTRALTFIQHHAVYGIYLYNVCVVLSRLIICQ